MTPIKDELNALVYKTYSQQEANSRFSNIPSEDCLYLNIFSPTTVAKNNLLPVYVHFHGGNFSAGTPNDPIYYGRNLSSKGVVVVTVEFRNDVFGYLKENGNTNYAVDDCVKALNFLKDNISLIVIYF